MGSDGTRKQTRGWNISPSGQMINIVNSEDIAIEEPPSGPVAAAPPPAPERLRPRRNTLDTFNDEMSVLDRPLEGEVEYEEPRPSRWGRLGMFVGIVAAVGIGGGFALSRRHAALTLVAEASTPAAATAPAVAAPAPAAPAPAAARPTVLAAASPAAEAAAAPVAADDDAGDDDSAQPAPASPVAWDKVKTKSGHGKRSRLPSGKTSHHHSSKHAIARKHSSSRHP